MLRAQTGLERHLNLLLLKLQGAIAKWLRRQIRNLFLFEGAGSNPAGVAHLLFPFLASLSSSQRLVASLYFCRLFSIVWLWFSPERSHLTV